MAAIKCIYKYPTTLQYKHILLPTNAFGIELYPVPPVRSTGYILVLINVGDGTGSLSNKSYNIVEVILDSRVEPL